MATVWVGGGTFPGSQADFYFTVHREEDQVRWCSHHWYWGIGSRTGILSGLHPGQDSGCGHGTAPGRITRRGSRLCQTEGTRSDTHTQCGLWGAQCIHRCKLLINWHSAHMRTRVMVVHLSVCLLPFYCLHRTFVQQNECTSQFCAKLQRFSTKGFC